MGWFSKLPYFGHETGPSAKVPEVAHIASFYRNGGEIELIFALRAAVSEIRADFQNCHIWAWNFAIGQSSRSCTYNVFLPQGVEIELIFALHSVVSEIRANFQNCHIWAWNLVAHILPELTPLAPPPPKPKFYSIYFALWLPKILAVLPFPIGHNVKFQNLNLKFQSSYK